MKNLAESKYLLLLQSQVLVFSPILLKNRLNESFYLVWQKYVCTITIFTDYSIHISDLPNLHHSIEEFITPYIKHYYQFKRHYFPAYKAVFHAFLHLVDSDKWLGKYFIKFLGNITYIMNKAYVLLFSIGNGIDVWPLDSQSQMKDSTKP